MKQLIRILRSIINHPINKDEKINSILRYIKWQINTKLNSFPIIYTFTVKSKLIVSKGMTGATGNLICGLHEYNDMFFLLHFLRKNDLFIDIGANIGSYTILAAAHIEANTISIEPIPLTYEHLIDNLYINRIQDKVKAHNIALGSKAGNIIFTKSLDTMNHVATDLDKDTIEVPILTLDKILYEEQIPALIKIDVEGFETEVIKGGEMTLQNNELKAIIIELNGCGLRYGYDESIIHNKLIQYGFKPFFYNPELRQLIEIKTYGKFNTIYLRNLDFVKERVERAPKVKIINKFI